MQWRTASDCSVVGGFSVDPPDGAGGRESCELHFNACN